MILRPSCGWCKDQDVFIVNEQLVVLVNCFKKICELISRSPILKHIQAHDEEIQQIRSNMQIVQHKSIHLYCFCHSAVTRLFTYT